WSNGFYALLEFDSAESSETHDLRTCQAGPVAFADVASIKYRVGRADQLTRPEYSIHVARNFLRTIEPALKDGPPRTNLAAPMLAAAHADTHAWIGESPWRLAVAEPLGNT